jgi:hypothetical protein
MWRQTLEGYRTNRFMAAALCLASVLASAAFAQSARHGRQEQPFSGGSTSPGASFGASGPAVVPPVVTGGIGQYYRGVGSGRGSYGYGSSRRYALPLSFYAAPYYYPSSYWDSSPYTDQYGPAAAAPDYGPDPTVGLAAELGALHREVSDLRQMMMGPPPPDDLQGGPGAATGARQEPPPPPPLVLIFRDGTQTQVRDFALIGQTLWDLSSRPTRKIALGQLNLEASIRATEALGAEFPAIQSQ